jgi:Surface glycan-binding protein B xyloglucan binding domain
MKKSIIVPCLAIVSCFLLIAPSGAMGGPAPKPSEPAAAPATAPVLAEKVFLIDNFESNSLKSPREWWTFDLQKAAPVSNKELKGGDDQVAAQVGNYSLQLSGPAKSWYVGGVGTYLAKEGQDLSKYNNIQLDVYGNGPGSGTMKIQLVDDDNNNWVVETDPKTFMPTKDDLWSYELKVDWDGWKRVSIPFTDFILENPGAGDGIWNPQQTNGSGGLLQMQIICLASSSDGKVNFNIDNISLTMGTNK